MASSRSGGSERLAQTVLSLADDRMAYADDRNAIDGDRMGVNARWDGDRVRFEYAAAILAAVKP